MRESEKQAKQKKIQFSEERRAALKAQLEAELGTSSTATEGAGIDATQGNEASAVEGGETAGIVLEGIDGEQALGGEGTGAVAEVPVAAPSQPGKKKRLTRKESKEKFAEFRRKIKSDDFNPNTVQGPPPNHT